MKTPNINDLNEQFSFITNTNSLIFKLGKGGIPIVEVQNEHASACISLQGAQVLSWIPKNNEEVIWLSEDAKYSVGQSVRGGIPICWPWFGAHTSQPSLPAHGFARKVYWQVLEVKSLVSGETQISFQLVMSGLPEQIYSMWPHDVSVRYTVTIGEILNLELTTTNHSDNEVLITQALHTYFNVEDLMKTTVEGLHGKEYLDKPDDFKRKHQSGAINFNDEVDRIYLDSKDDIKINNTKRTIVIKKQGSKSTVVWNPWEEVANKMGDMGSDGYLSMLCVESANAADDFVTIKKNSDHTLNVTYLISND